MFAYQVAFNTLGLKGIESFIGWKIKGVYDSKLTIVTWSFSQPKNNLVPKKEYNLVTHFSCSTKHLHDQNCKFLDCLLVR